METLHFDLYVNAPAERVWSALWDKNNYPEWSAVFAPGSHIRGQLSQGSRVRFLDRSGNGVYSIVNRHIPNKLMSFINLGEVFGGREQIVDERTSALEWSGAMESYHLHEKNGRTRLWVEIEVNKNDALLFAKRFPKALEKVKSLAEAPVEQFCTALEPLPAFAFRHAG